MPHNSNLEGKVAFITGGGTGIGAGIARAFAEAGAQVAIVGRRMQPLQDVVSDIEGKGGVAFAASVDVTQFEALDSVVNEVVDRFGHLDVVVSNAGGPPPVGPALEMTADDWKASVDVNLNGNYYTAKATVPHLRAAGGGHLIFMGSSTSYIPEHQVTSYAASKAALTFLMRVLALEHRDDRIAVNELSPGMVVTAAIGAADGVVPEFVLEHIKGNGEWLKQPEDVAGLALYMVGLPVTGTTGQIFNLGVNRT